MWKKRNAKEKTSSGRGRSFWSPQTPEAFMGGLRFRRLANEQECYQLTAEWEPVESMIEPAIARQKSRCSSCFPFFSPVGGQWKLKRKYPCYAENYRNFRRCFLSCTLHTIYIYSISLKNTKWTEARHSIKQLQQHIYTFLSINYNILWIFEYFF